MSKKQKIFIGLGVTLLALVIFGIYNNPDRKATESFTPQQETYLEKLGEGFQGFLAQNEKVKIITLEVVNALNTADSAFNSKSQQLLPEVRLLQSQLVDVRASMAEGKLIFFDEEKIRKVFEVLEEIYQFRYEYNQKVIETAEFGSTINFNNEQQMDILFVLLDELDEMEGQLPELQTKLVDALSAVDSRHANYLAEYPFLWK
ncbi:MAG: hypothetical protein AAB866_00310 [Patescibacteria group bacterium]